MFLERFKESPKDKLVAIITLFGLAIVLLTTIFIFMPIEASVPTYGILDYEFVWNSNRAETILSVWGAGGIEKQATAIYWDFLYIIGYVSLAFGLIVLILRKSESKVQKLGVYFILTPFLTGIFDIIENLNLLIMMDAPSSVLTVNAFTASLCARIKFSFLFAAIIYFIVALVIFITGRIKTRKK